MPKTGLEMQSPPEVILFDVGNTLLFPNWPRILAPLRARGVWPGPTELQAIERKTKRQFDQEMVKGQGKVDHSFWETFYTYLLNSVGLSDADLRQQLMQATHTSANWDIVQPDTREILQRIAQRFRIGVISNADGKIDKILNVCGIGDCFLHITDSGIVGHEKPHPAIFAAALGKMKAPAEHALYVGDVYSVDYIGATKVGMQAILMDLAGAYRDDGLPRVESLPELEMVLAQAYR
jgi:HAD superfamily hydrolase (TIGR01549 family)